MAEFSEGDALVLWCAMLPDLRRVAAAGSWSERLERAATRVRDGGAALDACRQFDLVDAAAASEPTRSTDGSGALPIYPTTRSPLSPRTGRGDYRCPRGRCARRDRRNAAGHPPVCALFDDEPMLPTGATP
ncbi:hypothetical protein [Actinoalloteichus hymeniacidonis]|uniref:Uncharacterized protein n=1 Tax=Actinoalloteichus hymeniacidonis TaxID=340345 RepID=A0AAC9MX04_9PSEU|nr:hypothetical protein [Actinoalloteichus hymeniacidonis]AOS61845.1 hypothetical protein TL08_05085 [Actinoalloteichus hymeniacidonis]MBB5910135.1 hypothetical protein [Actinoalloteichus hymeniacidonis]